MRGRLVPLGSFSSDEQWIVWEFMGGNGFYWEIALDSHEKSMDRYITKQSKIEI